MAVVKEDPLPPGRYWKLLLPMKEGQSFDGPTIYGAWYKVFGPPDTYVTQEVVEEIDVPDEGITKPDLKAYFVIFNVHKPTPWGIADKIGWPNDAPASVKTANDVLDVDNISEGGPLDWIGHSGPGKPDSEGIPWWGWVGGGAVMLFAIGYAVRSVR